MTSPTESGKAEPDIIEIILDKVRAAVPDVDGSALADLERDVRNQYGGLRVRIPKRRKILTPQERQAIVNAALSDTRSTNEQLVQQSGISRSSWYSMIKKKRNAEGGR